MFLLKNKSVGDAIAARVIQSAKAREASRAAASQVRRKTAISGRLNLPGKLHDCDSTNPEESELFIVEGDSAGGSAKQGRDRDIQAILPLKGKVLNAEQAGKAKVLDNKELTDIISALGLRHGRPVRTRPAAVRQDHPPDRRRQRRPPHRDALAHLLLPSCPGPFHRWAGCSWRARRCTRSVGARRRTGPRTIRRGTGCLSKLPSNAKPNITRFKGLGEMPAQLLFETTLDPARRRLLRVVVPDDDRPYTDRTVSDLMGKDPEARFKFIMEEAYTAKDIDI